MGTKGVQRLIQHFELDEAGDWVASLVCGHGQHARHTPPFVEREWVLTEAGRAERIGTALDCLRCDRRELPDGFAPYRNTPEFDEGSVPKALLRSHDTKRGIWAQIHVQRGKLEYTMHWPDESNAGSTTEIVRPGAPGIIVAEVPHQVRPLGEVSFHVEFWRASKPEAPTKEQNGG